MSQTLYRKYRPRNFSEIIGQSHVVRTLSGSIRKNIIGQAYLFTGSRGTGKTSIARIFAKTINCANLKDALPCEKCDACQTINSGKSLDIIEIDAASNTGVDNIRELRETVALSSASLKYKVYIIDEVHMLSTGAFNALLKTLEEPPAHVVFILATTEIHKVPDTIISRCQRFDFTRLPLQNIIEKLSLIAKAEKVKIEKEALEMIALSAEGGMRDAESLLGQIISLEDKDITLKEVEDLMGTADKKTAGLLAKFIFEKNSTLAIAAINKLLEDGYDLSIFNKSLINYLRQLMLLKIDPALKKHFSFELPAEQIAEMEKIALAAELPDILRAIDLFLVAQNKIASFVLPQLPLEIAIIKATQKFPDCLPIPPRPLAGEDVRRTGEGDKKTIPEKITPPPPTEKETDPETEEKKSFSNGKDIDLYIVKQNWPKLLVDIRPFNHSLSALLANCQPTIVSESEITLATPYDFYKERLDDVKNKLTVEQVFSKILEADIRMKVALDKTLIIKKDDSSSTPEKPSEQNSLLDSALEIMGGKVVKE